MKLQAALSGFSSPAPPAEPARPRPQSGEYRAAAHVADLTLPLTWTRVSLLPGAALAAVDGGARPVTAYCETVILEDDAFDASVHLVDGAIGWVESSAPLPTFLERLVYGGLVTAAEIELVSTLCRLDGLSVSDALFRLELVSRTALKEIVREHVKEHVRAILAYRSRATGSTRGATPRAQVRTTTTPLVFDRSLVVPVASILDLAERRAFREFVGAGGPSLPSSHDDLRVPLRRTARIETTRGALMMTTLDISLVGARLRPPSLLPAGADLVVHINIAGETLELPARVVDVESQAREAPVLVVAWHDLSAQAEASLSRVLGAIY